MANHDACIAPSSGERSFSARTAYVRSAHVRAWQPVTVCRICSSSDLSTFLDLGETPLANAFIRQGDEHVVEAKFPLAVMRCETCGLVQLTVEVAPQLMFSDYAYVSSASAPATAHFRELANELCQMFAPVGALVVEIGSNDGLLLRELARCGVRVLGIEPASNLAAAANEAGSRTWNAFFSEDVASKVLHDEGAVDVLVGNNVLAHIGNLPMVARAAGVMLAHHGVFVVEVPYLLDLLDNVEYDTIYHEHLSYFHLRPLRLLFAEVGLEVFDATRLSVHGGSIRLFVGRRGLRAMTSQLLRLIELERCRKLDEPPIYEEFAARVAVSAVALRGLLADLRRVGRRVAGWGATAKGNTLLNYCGIGTDTLEFIADSTPYKQGLLSPGMHVPVRAESAIYEEMPDYALLLAWNHAAAIVERHAEYSASGGQFIHPIPMPRVLNPRDA